MTSGYGTLGKLDYVLTACTSDGSLAISYLPMTAVPERELTLDLGQLARPLTGRWFNPADGHFTPVPGSPFVDSGLRQIRPPGDNGGKTNDWLLILETRRQAR